MTHKLLGEPLKCPNRVELFGREAREAFRVSDQCRRDLEAIERNQREAMIRARAAMEADHAE